MDSLLLSGLIKLRSRILVIILLVALFAPVSSSAAWLDTKEHNGIVYFLYDSPAQIKRYDLASEAFLSSFTLASADPASSFNVDGDGIYVAFGRSTNYYSLAGSNIGSLGNATSDITGVVSNDTHVFFHNNSIVRSVLKSTRATIDTEDYHYSVIGMSLSRSQNRIFARTVGISPSDINYINVAPDGTFDTTFLQVDSPYHGSYPSASETFLFPNENRVADDSGIIYATSDLTYSASLGGVFDDLTFYGDLPIVLRGNELISYSNTFTETGSFSYTSENVQQIAVHDDSVFGFYEPSAGIMLAVKTEISNLTPDTPGAPVSPIGLQYIPDSMAVDINGIAYLFSIAHQSIFRWSIPEQHYLVTIPLLGAPKFMTYSPENHSLYVAYQDGTINKIEIDSNISEEGFVILSQQALGLSTANGAVFAVDPSGAWVSHFTYNSAGSLISAVEWNYFSTEYIWNDANQKMYFFRDDTSPNDLLWEDINSSGMIGSKDDSPYHSSAGIIHPIRVAPNGSVVVLGSGRIYDAISLSQTNTLANNIIDAVWLGGELLTLKDVVSETIIQEWDASDSYSLQPEDTVEGEPFGFMQAEISGEHWLSVVSILEGYPVFRPIQMGDSIDIDADNIENIIDNCLYTPNQNQEDLNGDDIGDVCELDYDNDGVLNDVDNCPVNPNPDQENTNGGPNGDACELGAGGIDLGGGSGGDSSSSSDDFLLDIMPAILSAIKERASPPEWGVFSQVCCPSSSATFSTTLEATTLSSTLASCSTAPTFEGFQVSSKGLKSFSSILRSSGCGNYPINFQFAFEDSKRYLFQMELRSGNPTVVVYSEDIVSSKNITSDNSAVKKKESNVVTLVESTQLNSNSYHKFMEIQPEYKNAPTSK